MLTKLSPLLLSLVLSPSCVDQESELGSTSLPSEHHGAMECEPAPVMLSGDFNANGVIDSEDVQLISDYKDSGGYAAYWDMNADGRLNGQDVSIVARNMHETAHTRDAQMASLWATTEPYLDQSVAIASGYVPFTPDLKGHGMHFSNPALFYGWVNRGGFDAAVPEGLNYSSDGELIAAFYYAPGATDLNPADPGRVIGSFPVPPSFDGIMNHEWHHHVGACFGGASPLPGFDQCTTRSECVDGYGGTLWAPKFHMLHVWLFEYNACGPFAGVDMDTSVDAPEEPNHMACELADLVDIVIPLGPIFP